MNQRNIQSVYAIFLLSLIVAFFGLLQPGVSHLLFAAKRTQQRESFLARVQQHQRVDAQDFWEFRDTYNPGSMTFNSNLGDVAGVIRLHDLSPVSSTLFTFRSKYLVSFDQMIVNSATTAAWLVATRSAEKMLFQDATTAIFRDKHDVLRVTFLKPVSEMKIANGYFDYLKREQEVFAGRVWLNETWIY